MQQKMEEKQDINSYINKATDLSSVYGLLSRSFFVSLLWNIMN